MSARDQNVAETTAEIQPAELRLLAALALAPKPGGGEIVARRYGARACVERLDAAGRALERFPPRATDALRRRGLLTVRRFEHGGVVLGLSAAGRAHAGAARAAYWSPERGRTGG